MNINPSDTDVRQGFSLAENAASVQMGSATQMAAETHRSAANNMQPIAPLATPGHASDGPDERSLLAAATADRTSAREAAQKLEQQLKEMDIGLKIRVLDDSQNRVQVEIVDERSNKVLRKIPQDELLKLSASIKEMSGILLDNPA